jgi:predicted GNAT superfamily acetyltransferase
LTWLIGGARTGGVPLINAQALTLDLTHHVGVEKVNEGWLKVNYTLCGPLIAIEIPADWTALQNEFIGEAIRWREATDHIFQHYVGQSPGKYVITGVGVEGERRYLIGERADDGLWERLGQG